MLRVSPRIWKRGSAVSPGFVGAAVALLSYNCLLIGLYGFFGFITSSVVADLTGAQTDWKLWTFLAWSAVAILAHREINLSAKVLGVLMIGEVLILLLFDAAVLVQGGATGIDVEAFHPGNVLTDGLGVAILFAAASFVGFEATAIYGEEAREPARTVPRATYMAVLLIAVFYSLSTWAIGLAYGGDRVRQAALDNPPGFVFAVNDQYVGAWSTVVMNVLVVTSMFAVLLAFHNTLARSRVLPGRLGRTHRRWLSPHWSSAVGSVVTAVVVSAFALAGADPFAQMYAWLVGVGTVGVVSMQAATCIAVVAFFRRRKRDEFRWWNCAIAPLLGAAGLTTIAYLAWTNWTLLTGATAGLPAHLPWLVVAAVLVGIAWAGFTRPSGVSVAGALGHAGHDKPHTTTADV